MNVFQHILLRCYQLCSRNLFYLSTTKQMRPEGPGESQGHHHVVPASSQTEFNLKPSQAVAVIIVQVRPSK